MSPVITHREFKLLLKPEQFPTRRAVLDFNQLLETSATTFGLRYEPFDAIDSLLRTVQFYDTAEHTFRSNDLIFRIRQLRQGGWPDESCEVTFKLRAPDLTKAAGFDNNSTFATQQKNKFKEEILYGGATGTMVSIYSNNCILGIARPRR